jgi:hypothetical protein
MSVRASKVLVAAGFVSIICATATARAQTNPPSCINDIDCAATPACGGDVCDWVAAPTMTCKPAGTQPKGTDGWCMVNSDCKCAAMGATCNANFSCTFTRACDAPGAPGCGAGGSGAGGSGAGGSTGTAGTGGGGDSGGCSVAATGDKHWAGLLLAGLLLVLSRRRAARVKRS